MKYLVIYYSRTGTTANIAEILVEKMDASIEKLIESRDRSGVLGYLKSGWEALREKSPQIEGTVNDPAQFDMIIIGTPVWAGNMAPAVRTYIKKYNREIKNYALFCTYKGSGAEKTFSKIEKLFSEKAVAKMDIIDKEINKGSYKHKIEEFIKKIADN